jgi:hypothetical protein
LLEPEKAFIYSAKQLEPGKIEARFQIAQLLPVSRQDPVFRRQPASSLGEAGAARRQGQAGRFFGKVETYRGDIASASRSAMPTASPRHSS